MPRDVKLEVNNEIKTNMLRKTILGLNIQSQNMKDLDVKNQTASFSVINSNAFNKK